MHAPLLHIEQENKVVLRDLPVNTSKRIDLKFNLYEQNRSKKQGTEKIPGFSLREFLSKNCEHNVNPNFYVKNPLVFDRLKKHFLPKDDSATSNNNTLDIAKKLLAAACIDICAIVKNNDHRELQRQSTRELIVIPGSLLFIAVELLKKLSKETIHPVLQWRYERAATQSEDDIVYNTTTECLDAFENVLLMHHLDIHKYWLIFLPGCLTPPQKKWLSQYCEVNKCINWHQVKDAMIEKYDTFTYSTKVTCLERFCNLHMSNKESIDDFIIRFEYLRHVAQITDEATLCQVFQKALFAKLRECFKIYLTHICDTDKMDLSKAGVSIDFLVDLTKKTYDIFFTHGKGADEIIAGTKRARENETFCIFHPHTRAIHSTSECRLLKKYKE